MGNRLVIVCLLLIIVILTRATKASATLISLVDPQFGNGSFTMDTATGLQWLDLSLTLNKSMNYINANSGTGGTYNGLRYATQSELETLIADAGIYPAIGGSSDKARYDAVNNLLGYIGYAPGYSNPAVGSLIIYGITGTGPVDQDNHYISAYLYLPAHYPGDYTSIVNIDTSVDGIYFNPDSQGKAQGNFLVRDTHVIPTPEPSTFLLLGAGFAGFGFIRKRMGLS